MILDIGGVGGRGDALAVMAPDSPSDPGPDSGPDSGAPVFVPFALPGERVRARVAGGRGAILSLERASADRVAPPCAHFTRCGGCQLQHWAETPYLDWKRAEVVRALSRRGLDAPVDPTLPAWGAGRRRAALHAIRAAGVLRLGFAERGSARIEDIDDCPALVPALAQALPGLRDLWAAFAPARGMLTMHIAHTDTGIDVALRGAAPGFDLARLEKAAELAERLDLARLTVDGEPMVTRRTPLLTIGRARVTPPPGAFLQATQAGEDALAALVIDGLVGDAAPPRRVADLYCGLGAFALRIADFAEVHAAEGDAQALAALKAGADAMGGALGITVQQRDLARDPLMVKELAEFDAVTLDPPRAGAKEQAAQITASAVRRVVAVSCDPATFARDARILVDGGFRLLRVTPVDQFRWTAHVELVAVLAR